MEIGENPDIEFSTPQRRPENKELEVMGISRSGRVRKKSSKLVDFESSKNILIESKPKKAKSSPQDRSKKQKISQDKHSSNRNAKRQKQNSSLLHLEQTKVRTESSSDYDMHTTESESEQESPSRKDAMQSPEYTSEDDSGIRDTGSRNNHTSQTKNSRTPEQYGKKLIIDVKAKEKSKSQRKDKGKTRFTAYMLWSKEMRQEIVKKNPHMDFTSISKRLGELWGAVPSSEKYNWTKRAKRLAATPAPSASNKQFINKNQSKELDEELFKSPQMVGTSPKTKNVPIAAENRSVKELIADSLKGATLTRVIDTKPIDVAAYLKLLGESLTLIGERLKEHNGQIAVSGSLSVLLDSLLCALGSLTCLTQQIPVIGHANTESLTKTLENIAYIMPGL